MIPFSDEELMPVVSKILDKVRSMLVRDGGDMKLLGIKNGRVFIQFQGACNGCASSDITLKLGVERQLRIDIHPEMEVINIANESEMEKYQNEI
ncbi:MAG: NifU family protein [Campylobacteraceae bacterium]|jgi:Fe-S cluster biogenesis protein NfuA|nr:NifU family protein [Campylobacteraceae bacterium]